MVGKAEPRAKPAKKDDQTRPATASKRSPARKTTAPKSPTRTKSPSRAKPKSPVRSAPISPSRATRKSPTRATGRSPIKAWRDRSVSPERFSPTSMKRRGTRSPGRKSPSRKAEVPKQQSGPKLPARKSPSRRSPIRKIDSETIKKIYSTQEIIVDSDSDNQSDAGSNASRLSTMNLLDRLNRKTPVKESSVESIENVRRSSRLREHVRVVHVKNNYEPVAKLTEFSDEDEQLEIEDKPKPKQPSRFSKINVSGILKVLFSMLLTVGYFFGMLAVCNERDCSLRLPSPKDFLHIKTYFDVGVLWKYTAYVAAVAGLSALPFGGRRCVGMPGKSGKLEYVMNGLFSAGVILSVVAGMERAGVNVCEYILDNFYKLAISGFVLAFPIGVLVFVRSFYVPLSNLNSDVMENSHLQNFLYGCENNPRFWRIDVKMVLFRASFISMVLVTISTLYQNIEIDSRVTSNTTDVAVLFLDHKLEVNVTLLVLHMMMILYALDVLWFEHMMVSMAEIQYESFGYIKCLEYCCFISLYALIPKVVFDHNVQLESWKLGIALTLFAIGYVFYRGSNSQKHKFRENPYSPSVAHLESIPTGGKKIICSSYWGIVRHPNYLGDILMNASFLLFVAWYPPFISILLSVFGLVERAYRDNKRCKQRYGTAWDRYCHRVKYMLIPKVY